MTATGRRALGAALAALLVGGTMAVLAVIGEDGRAPRSPDRPDLPLLADQPLPGASGTVALHQDGGGRCISVVDVATGASRDLRCERDLAGERPRWTAEGDLEVIRHEGPDAELLVLDAQDGEVRRRRLVDWAAVGDGPDGHPVSADGRRLVVGADDERTWLEVVTPSGGTERILTVPAGTWAGFTAASWSPDERFALVEGHSAVYVVELATGEARVLADGARDAVWGPVSGSEPGATR